MSIIMDVISRNMEENWNQHVLRRQQIRKQVFFFVYFV